MPIERKAFGNTGDGAPVYLFILENSRQSVAKLTNYGARLTELHVPDRGGRLGDVTLGFDNLSQYLQPEPFFGTTVGRFANRIANARFMVDDVEYILPANDGPNSLHGGACAWDKRVWRAVPVERSDGPGVDFSYDSPDGDDGFPGTVNAMVRYTWTNNDELRIEYEATTDKATPINLTNHSYFNLAGDASGEMLGHILTLNASRYTPVDSALIPTGAIEPVSGTPLDFTAPTPIGARIAETGLGYDHNFVIDANGAGLSLAARVSEPQSGRTMEVLTSQPGVQLYTGNHLDGTLRGVGGIYRRHGAFCLETQHFPDSVHHPQFPNAILRPGTVYRHTTIYRFGVAESGRR